MPHSTCKYCNKPVVLKPSAEERAKKFGGNPGMYRRMFTTHAKCAVEAREADTLRLIRERKV